MKMAVVLSAMMGAIGLLLFAQQQPLSVNKRASQEKGMPNGFGGKAR